MVNNNAFSPQVGDIILVRKLDLGNIFLMLLSWFAWTHSALYSGDGKTTELRYKTALTHKPFSTYRKRPTRVLRFTALNDSMRQELKFVMDRPCAFMFDKIGMITPLVVDERKFLCYSYIEWVYSEALGYDLNMKKIFRNNSAYMKSIGLEVVWDGMGLGVGTASEAY